MTTPEHPLPRWDMTTIFPSIESPEFAEAFRAANGAIDELAELFDRLGANAHDQTLAADTVASDFDNLLGRFDAVTERTETVRAYVESFILTNSGDDLAQAKMSEFRPHVVRLSQLGTRLTAWIGSLDVEELCAQSDLARDHAFFLRQQHDRATHLMSPAQEELAAELGMTGGMAWTNMRNDLASQLTVLLEHEGKSEELPISAVLQLAYQPDRELRRSAHEAEQRAWQATAAPMSAALNAVKGETLSLSRRRGWASPLAAALGENAIDEQILTALIAASRETFPALRRYLRAKARALGVSQLAWYDRWAPLGENTRVWSYDEATTFIPEQFVTYSDRLRAFAEKTVSENWIDAEPRAGKETGGLCQYIRRGESRILVNYTPAYDCVSTLAHELGHAYHVHVMAEANRTTLHLWHTPIPLFETASIFCESLVRHAAYKRAEARERLAILDGWLGGATSLIIGVIAGFLFEERLFARRAERELSAEELTALYRDCLIETFGNGMVEATLPNYLWASIPHYYIYGVPYYNYPYLFGLLFSLGLFAQFQSSPADFPPKFDDLLASTGSDDPASLAARFGIDLRSPGFWRSSLAVLEAEIDDFEALTR